MLMLTNTNAEKMIIFMMMMMMMMEWEFNCSFQEFVVSGQCFLLFIPVIEQHTYNINSLLVSKTLQKPTPQWQKHFLCNCFRKSIHTHAIICLPKFLT